METMFSVRHLTLKLRSQSLNEEPHLIEKSDPDRDSGTESDDELAIDDRKMEQQSDSTIRRSSAGRERTRSDSGKENSSMAARPSGRNRRTSLQRYTESVMASTLAAVAALSASDEPPGRPPIDPHGSPVEFGVTDSALPSDSDHGAWGDQHSSEEELECINETAMLERGDAGAQVRANHNRVAALRFGPSAFGPPGHVDAGKEDQSADHRQRRSVSNPQQGPEKRKWDRVQTRRSAGSGEWTRGVRTRPRSAILGVHHPQQQTSSSAAAATIATAGEVSSAAIDCCYSASSDDEVQSLVGNSPKSPLPLEFRTSPPEGAHRPTRSLSPPPKFFLADNDDEEEDADVEAEEDDDATAAAAAANANASVAVETPAGAAGPATARSSPRKRHHHHRHHHLHRSHKQPIQRPCLDFEKMQQMKNRSLSTWRHDGELSLFCW